MENTENVKNTYKKPLIIVGIVLLFTAPLLFLVFKSSGDAGNGVEKPAISNEIATLENQVKTNPDYNNLVNLSVAYINNNEPARATPYLEQALKLVPNSAIVFNNLGVVNIMTRNFQQAIDFCSKALVVDNNFELAKNNLKWAMNEITKTKTMVEAMEKKPANERDTNYYIQLGIHYLSLGNYDKSILAWQEGLKKDSKNTVFFNNIGTALIMKKQYDEAILQFNEVLKLEPASQLASNNIKWAMAEKANTVKE